MCLTIDKENTEHFANTMKKKGGQMTVYKYLQVIGNRICSPYRSNVASWKVGVNISDRQAYFDRLKKTNKTGRKNNPVIIPNTLAELTSLEISQNQVFYGFHAYVYREYAATSARNAYHDSRRIPVVVKLTGKLEDFVGTSQSHSGQDIVFTKLTLDPAVRRKVIESVRKVKERALAREKKEKERVLAAQKKRKEKLRASKEDALAWLKLQQKKQKCVSK